MNKLIIASLFFFSTALILLGANIYYEIVFNKNCSSYLKSAANASSINIAQERLSKALEYLEANWINFSYLN